MKLNVFGNQSISDQLNKKQKQKQLQPDTWEQPKVLPDIKIAKSKKQSKTQPIDWKAAGDVHRRGWPNGADRGKGFLVRIRF